MGSKTDAKGSVYKYLAGQNRPYSANDIMLNLHNEFGKTVIQKALDDLTRENKIREKVYGKQKIYCVVQEDAQKDEADTMGMDLVQLDTMIDDITDKLKTAEGDLKTTETALRELKKQPTLEECIKEKKGLIEDIKHLTIKVDNLSNASVVISKEERNAVVKESELYTKEYRKRKRICMDIINSILENCTKPKKSLLEEIGIETDEDVSFKI